MAKHKLEYIGPSVGGVEVPGVGVVKPGDIFEITDGDLADGLLTQGCSPTFDGKGKQTGWDAVDPQFRSARKSAAGGGGGES